MTNAPSIKKRSQEAHSTRRRRERLGLTRAATALLAGMSITSVQTAETSGSAKTCARINAALDKYEQRNAAKQEASTEAA